MVAAFQRGRRAVDHAGVLAAVGGALDRGVLPAPAAPGHPRPGLAGASPRPTAPGVAASSWPPGRRWSLLALVLGLVPALVLGALRAARWTALIEAVAR